MDVSVILVVVIGVTLLCIPAANAHSKGRPIGFVILGSLVFYPAALIGAIAMDRDEERLAEWRRT